MRWDEENRKNGLPPVEFQYYDDDSASSLAPQSGRADLTFGPNAGAAYKAAQAALNELIENGTYAKILDRWGLSSEAIQKSELNPQACPKIPVLPTKESPAVHQCRRGFFVAQRNHGRQHLD